MWMGRKRRFLDAKPIDRHDPATTIVGAGTSIAGDLSAPADAIVSGTIEGCLEVTGRLHLTAGGLVRGSVSASAAKVEGAVEGPVTVAGHLEVGTEARVVGDIEAGRLAIAEGALVHGTLRSEAPAHRFVESRRDEEADEAMAAEDGEAVGVTDES